jgi:CheY-like chemotaxis protein
MIMACSGVEPVPSALIVDDEFYNRDVFRIALESVGYEVMDAANGAIGLDILGKQTFNLLILDLQMPVINGREVLKKLRQMPLHKDMQVAVITANVPMATDEIHEYADYVMYKPINVQAFAQLAMRLRSLKAV